jgi:peptidoglycan/LPS O-acetylase OafA/YrhL
VPYQHLAFQTWALGFALVFAWLLERPLRIGRTASAFRRLGVFSYSLYAIHVPLIALAVCVLFNGQQQMSLLPTLLLLLATVACAFLFHLVFERPFIALLAKRPESSPRRRIRPLPLAFQEAKPAQASILVPVQQETQPPSRSGLDWSKAGISGPRGY